MAAQTPVCLYNKYGYCKHKEMCRKRHVKEICDNNSCEVYKCTFRHPKICKFFWNDGQCKFDPCAFLHKDNENSVWKLKKENDIFKEKIDLKYLGKNHRIFTKSDYISKTKNRTK